MEWNAKGYERGAGACFATVRRDDMPANLATDEILPGGAIASEEEFAHLERCLKNPKAPSSTILEGAALLQLIQKRR
jgi:hypothetical protein